MPDRLGHRDGADRLERYDEADTIYPALRPTDDYEAAMVNARLGVLRSAQGKHSEALALLRASADYFSAQSLPARLAPVLLHLGDALLADRRASEALEALQQAYAILTPAHRNGSPDLADISVGLARAHLVLGQTAEAVRAAQSAVAFWRSFDSTNRHAGFALLWLARASMSRGATAEARASLEQAAAILRRSARPSDRELLAQTQRELAPTA